MLPELCLHAVINYCIDAKFISRSNEYPLFIPRQNSCSTGGDTSWSDRSSSNFGVTSVESEKKAHLDSSRSSSFNYSSASPHSVETHQDLQKGISLLKKSVACVTAYCYNSLCLDVPSELSTFEAFAKLLATLSSSKEVRSVFSLKGASSRYLLHFPFVILEICIFIGLTISTAFEKAIFFYKTWMNMVLAYSELSVSRKSNIDQR